MTRPRPDLATAIDTKFAEQTAAIEDRFARTGAVRAHYEQRATRLDQLADRAKTDPVWFNGLSDYERQHISNWQARRTNLTNSPKDAA